MRAAVITAGAVRIEERPDPVPGHGQLLVRVRAAGLNGADLIQRAGRYPAPPDAPADIPGLELAGEVAVTGPGVLRFAEGDRVMALVGGGGQAELALTHERHALPVPGDVDWPSAGGFVEVFATAHDAMFSQAELTLGERLLVQGAAGGVGVAAVQLGRAAGATVVATVRAEHLRGRVAELGARVVAPEALGDEAPFDVILELVGGEELARDPARLGTGGRLVVIGTGAGARAEIDFHTLAVRRARVHASTLRSRSLEEKALVVQRLDRHVLPLLADGRVVVPIEQTLPLAEVGAAYERFAAGAKLGKIVLLA